MEAVDDLRLGAPIVRCTNLIFPFYRHHHDYIIDLLPLPHTVANHITKNLELVKDGVTSMIVRRKLS